ncbi:MAG: cytochrome C oxidase subunit IV family protein [Planctomycetota bacterium]
MAITNDSGVRGTAAVSLADITDEDRQLTAERADGLSRGLSGLGAPVSHAEHDEPHVAPLWIMYGTFAALVGLTVLTVGARFVDFGAQINIMIALGLAFLKAVLVAMFFMHLIWDSKLNQLILVSTLLFLTIFIGVAIIDSDQYQPILDPADAYTTSIEAAGE